MATFEHSKTGRLPARPHGYEAAAGGLGALAGAGLGLAVAGPPGAIAGIFIGGAIGACTGWVAHNKNDVDEVRDERRDREIGVIDGDLGVPGLEHPPSRIGAFSREASGAGSVTETKRAEGPIEPPPE